MNNIIQRESLRQNDTDILLNDYLNRKLFTFKNFICDFIENFDIIQFFIEDEIWISKKTLISNFDYVRYQNNFYIYKRIKCNRVGFEYFWSDFFDLNERGFFIHLLSLIPESLYESNINNSQIIYHSHFGNNFGNYQSTKKYIFFSGEKYSIPHQNYKLSLCHEQDTDNIICYPLFFFIINSYSPRYDSIFNVNYSLDIPKEFCAFVVGNPNCQIRNSFFRYVSLKYKKVSSYGKVMNNVGYHLNFPYNDVRQLELLSRHKFVICFENTKTDNYYITEKLLIAKSSGCVPIYWGTQKCLELFNRDAFLYLEDETEKGFQMLLDQIKVIDNNEELYLKIRNASLLRKETRDKFNICNIHKQIKNKV
jgi:hypothetical protein